MNPTGNIARLTLTLTAMVVFTLLSYSQQIKTTNGKIEVIQDPRVEILVRKHIEINQKQTGIEGFRIQLFFDSGNNAKIQAQAMQEEFRTRYPEVEAYLSYKSPNYRVRVGDFRSRLDAQYFLNKISMDFPNAFITEDQIQLPKDIN